MEQLSYKYEVVLNLLKKENYLRQIARDLKTNHMTIKRVLNQLLKEKVVDVREEGKNNVYSIKITLEAESMVYRAEHYKFTKLLRKHPELKLNIKSLKKLPVNLIIIFGSYAIGREKDKSDIDIYIETENRKIKEAALNINENFSVKIGKYSKESILIREIEDYHIIIKGVERFYEKNKFFKTIMEGGGKLNLLSLMKKLKKDIVLNLMKH